MLQQKLVTTERVNVAMYYVATGLIAAFFLLVGYWKALGPVSALMGHQAWFTILPEWITRLVGVSELLCAAVLVFPRRVLIPNRLPYLSLWVLLANQMVATTVHLAQDEAHLLLQNGFLLSLIVMAMYLCKRCSNVQSV